MSVFSCHSSHPSSHRKAQAVLSRAPPPPNIAQVVLQVRALFRHARGISQRLHLAQQEERVEAPPLKDERAAHDGDHGRHNNVSIPRDAGLHVPHLRDHEVEMGPFPMAVGLG
jgi:hypothetical protein